MALLHDPGNPEAFTKRVQSLKSDTHGTWGRMTVDQMLRHVNTSLAESLGEYKAARTIKVLPEFIIRALILYGPWGKGAPTRPDMKVPEGERFDFATEQKRTLDMIRRITTKSLDASWPRSANFECTGRHWSTLHYRHLDHHLRQFGV